MSTAADIIGRGMRLLGQLESGGTPDADEYADGLVALNGVLSDANNEMGLCYALREEELTLSDGVDSYSVGPSGDLTTTRPVEIVSAWIEDDGATHSVRIIPEEEYDAIPVKATEGDWPDQLLYRPAMPNGTVVVYPLPNATRTLHLVTRTPLTAFADTSDTVTLPPGWEPYLAHQLACVWAPEFEMPGAPPAVVAECRRLKANIKRMNQRPVPIYTEIGALTSSRGGGSILTDG